MTAQSNYGETTHVNKSLGQRRDFMCRAAQLVVAAVASASAVGLVSFKPVTTGALAGAEPLNKEEWLQEWMHAAPAGEHGQLVLFRFKDPMYVLVKPISWAPRADQAARFARVEVPKGFVTDLASVPRVFWSLLRPDGNYAYAAAIHDYLYWFQPTTREDADLILKHVMEDFAISRKTIDTIYYGVRAAGDVAWTTNARLKAEGEKRVLSKTPEDPRVTWAEWKSRPGVFAK